MRAFCSAIALNGHSGRVEEPTLRGLCPCFCVVAVNQEHTTPVRQDPGIEIARELLTTVR